MANKITELKPYQQKEKKKGRKKRIFFRLISLLSAVILVCAAVALIVYHDSFNLDSIVRSLAYINVSRNDSGQTDSFSFSDQQTNCVFTLYDNGLAVASIGGVSIFNKNGDEIFNVEQSLDTPAIDSSKALTAVYELGGKKLIVLNSEKTLMNTELDRQIVDLDVNDSGWLALTTGAQGYKGEVTVYNAEMAEEYQFYSAGRFLLGSEVSPDCKSVAVASIGQDNVQFDSMLSLYSLEQEQAYATYSLPNELIKDFFWMEDDKICVISENGVEFLNGSAELQTQANCPGVEKYSFGDDFVAISESLNKAGSRSELVSFSSDGKELGRVNLPDDLLSLSASKDYIAALLPDEIRIYTPELKLYASTNELDGIKHVLMRADGTAILIGTQSASLYIPKV